MNKKQSLYDEIMEAMENMLEDSKTDGHYKEDKAGLVHHALATNIAIVKAIKERRELEKIS